MQFKDVVCHIFPYTFENSASTWYFNLPFGSITSWTEFQKDFIDKFREETTIGALMVELFSLVMGLKEKFKDFNQRFTKVLNKFQEGTAPAPELQIEVYVNALPASISMFDKQAGINTLALNFEEAKKIEFEMKGCRQGQNTLRKKDITPPKKGLILMRPQTKQLDESKENDSIDMEDLQR
jgi:hypothetical protein